MKIVCPCLFGLESVLSYEVKKIGGENVVVCDGRVSFEGGYEMVARANLCLSTAERVLIELGHFHVESFEELYQGVKALPLENFIGRNDAFPVKGHSINSKLHSVPDCQRIIKKAAVERLKSVYGVSWFEESGDTYQIQFNILRDEASICLDTTGISLHKRGYRRNSNDAPIKETLAAGIVDFARIRRSSVVVDPMCGSGTFLIESAYKALNVAVGIRRSFAAEKWGSMNKDFWKTERDKALSSIDKTGEFKALGFDVDDMCVDLSQTNAKKAGVFSKVTVRQQDIARFKPIKNSITICNPPYGERLLDIKSAEKLYKIMGERLRPDKDNPCYIISPHEEFEKFFGKKADKRRKLYNGMIKCQLFMYFK
ncbi:MAG: class I SAM-dependent RNA methyltransferase [Ruminococcus sp.]|nr:class I SAM-dependent RNA methyltransferase [Ruminococcus sp.]